MGQARTLKDKELKQVLNYVQYHRHALGFPRFLRLRLRSHSPSRTARD